MAISIDGTNSGSFTDNHVGAITLTTSGSDDIILVAIQSVVDIGTAFPYVNTILGGGLTFKQREIFINFFNDKTSVSEVWFARAPSPLAAQSFDITLNAVAQTCAIFIFGTHSPDKDNPFDFFFDERPIFNSDETGSITVPQGGRDLETLGSNDLVLGFRFSISAPSGVTPGSGFTSVGATDVTGAHIYVEARAAPSPRTSYTVSEGQSLAYWCFFADALTETQSTEIGFGGGNITLRPIPEPQVPEQLANDELYYIGIKINIYDRFDVTTKIIRICNRGPLFDIGGEQFLPQLEVPILLGVRIGADVYGQRLKGEVAGGDIMFTTHMLEEFFNPERYHWMNQEFEIYTGISDSGELSDLDLIYTGVINDMTIDNGFLHASLKTADKSNLLNKPLLTEVYDASFPPAIVGKLKPRLLGRVIGLEPVLEDEVNLIYRVSWGVELDDVTNLRVGGVPWDKVASPPGPGQYSFSAVGGTVQLGSDTLGGAVRCDAQSVGYADFYTGDLLSYIINLAGGISDSESERFFSSNHDDRVGYWTGTESLNVLDLLDEITYRQGGWWSEANGSGKILYKPLTYPRGPFVSEEFLFLSQVEILSIQQSKLIPAIWRIRVEYAPNWTPINQFFEGVSDVEKALQSATGILPDLVNGLFDNSIKDLDPAAGDIYLRTLCWEKIPAYFIGSRLFGAWRFERRLFDVKAFCDPSLVKIYTNVNLRYSFLNLTGLAHSAVKSIGGGSNQFQIWG